MILKSFNLGDLMSLKYKTYISKNSDIETNNFKEISLLKKINYDIQKIEEIRRSINVQIVLKSLHNYESYNHFIYKFFHDMGYEACLSEEIFEKSLERNSLVNFIRYFNELEYYFKKREFYIELTELGFINIRLMSKNHNTGYIELTFNKNGKVDYISLDKEYDPLEKKTYVMRGCIETSDRLQKSYKINRLMSILRHLDLENKATSWNFYINN